MRIVFCINDHSSSGGRERVLSQRVNYLIKNYNYDITIVTLNKTSKPYFDFDLRVRIINLDIKHSKFSSNCIKRKIEVFKLRKKQLIKLNIVISKIEPDILVSFGDETRYICGKIKYNCKKILEHHGNKESYTGENSNINFLKKIRAKYSNYVERKIFLEYNAITVLTNSDKLAWNYPEIIVIGNPSPFDSKIVSSLTNKKVLSVGRLSEEKGYDILIDVWKKVNKKHSDWILEIYGEGDLKKELQNKICSLKLEDVIFLRGTEKNIASKYLESSLYIMSSKREGFGMVLVEAMTFGLPLVAFDCPSGPRNIIRDNINGFLCKVEDINEMTEKINFLIENKEKRIEMGKKSKELSYNYSEEKILNQWKDLYESL